MEPRQLLTCLFQLAAAAVVIVDVQLVGSQDERAFRSKQIPHKPFNAVAHQ